MSAKAILILCAQVLFIQAVFSQCTSRAAIEASRIGSSCGFGGPLNNGFTGLAYDGLAFTGNGCGGRGLAYDGFYSPAMEFSATSGGALPVTSSSAMGPVGISIVSDNVYEGALNVAGELPFVSTTALEGVLATAGCGAINHACGNGRNAMSALSGTSTPASVASAGPIYGSGLAYDGLYSSGLAGSTCGNNAFNLPYYYADAAYAGRGSACNGLSYGSAYDTLSYGSPCDGIEYTPTSGGALPVSSASAIPPTGIVVASDNAYEGALAVGGELPFVGTVAMEGVVPSAGAGAVNHCCGNGRNAMISETAAYSPAGAYSSLSAYGPGPAFAPSGFGSGFGVSGLGYRGAGRGCGCAF